MERMISQTVAGSNGILASQPTSFPPGQTQAGPGQLGSFDMSFIDCDSTMFDGGAQYTPDLDFSAVQGPVGCPTHPDFPSELEFHEPRIAIWDAGNMAPVYARPNQVPVLATGHHMSQYNITPRYPDDLGIMSEEIDGGPSTVEGDCHLKDTVPRSSEVMSQMTAGTGIRPFQNIDWEKGGAFPPEVPCIGSELKPQARPSELGDEYVSFRLDDVENANSNLLSDHQTMNFDKPLTNHPKPNARDDVRLLGPKQACIGRRRSVPHRRLRKLSSQDQGNKHPQSKGTRTQIAGTQVFDVNMKIKPTRTKRRFSEGEKERIALVRKAGACRECRRMKRKV